jgi:hypothetical protein
MSAKISILLPTRGRKSLAERFMASAIKLSKSPEKIEFILYVDEDDLESQTITVDNFECRMVIGPRCNMGVCNSRCLKESVGEIIILGNDDVVIRTAGWDEKIRIMHDSLPDQIYLAYPNDLNKGEKLSAFPVMSRKTCDLVSQPFPIIYKGAFIDTHLMEIFIRLKKIGNDRIIYMNDVVFEHLHFRVGKVEIDQTYKDRDRFADDMAFLSLYGVRKDTAKYLKKVINSKENNIEKFQYKEPLIIGRPASLKSMIRILANLYLFDIEFPLRLRIRNFFYFILRWKVSGMKFIS